jgi:hypothetical protein
MMGHFVAPGYKNLPTIKVKTQSFETLEKFQDLEPLAKFKILFEGKARGSEKAQCTMST